MISPARFDITVCIPAYNAAQTIERAITSIVAQDTTAQVEILVCDDGSTDATRDVLARLRGQHRNLRVLCNDTNRGRPFTRTRLLGAARGRYLTWLDADDEKYPTMLGHQYRLLERIRQRDGAEALVGLLVHTRFDWQWPGMAVPRVMAAPKGADQMEALLDARFGGYLWLMMGTTETFRAVGPFDEALPRLQDLDFFLRFAQKGGRFRPIDDSAPQCIYYKEDSGRGADQVWRSWGHIWRKHRALFEAYGFENARKWRRHHYRVARRFAKANADWVTFARIAAQEAVFASWSRAARVLHV